MGGNEGIKEGLLEGVSPKLKTSLEQEVSDLACCLFWEKKLYQNHTMFIHLCIVCGCLRTSPRELSSYDPVTHSASFITKGLLTADVIDQRGGEKPF